MAPAGDGMNGSAERLADGTLVARRDAPIGGQAVLEGVMMRGVSTWAVAVRKPTAEQVAAQSAEENGKRPIGEVAAEAAAVAVAEGGVPAGAATGDVVPAGDIEVQSFPLVSVLKRHRVLRWPIVRGVVALGESMAIGFKALGISANAQLPEDEKEISGATWAGTVAFAVLFAVGLFFLLPAALTSLTGVGDDNGVVFVVLEKIIRIGIFLAYLWLISRMRDLQRVFEYHGAEHKVISCYEAGLELTPENAQKFSRLHPRCGTSFLLIVMIVAIVVFAPLGSPEWYWLFASRIIGIPIVAGLAFEVIKWFGRNRSRPWARALMWPGLQLQRLTTRPPDLAQLAVAIAALQAVLAVEKPGEATDEDKVGMEVVA